jgi:hypothetical protein
MDWNAQILQEPGKKSGTAILLKGQEGVGKNRITDMYRMVHGSERFLQTASPANTLYGRFNRQREGRTLVVVNESSGTDNFAAVEVIKDMITCDEFQSEGKGTNAYTMNCFARFIFTTNNDNCMRVTPDSRRFVVVEVSSALKGQTQYFNELSTAMESREGQYAFYRYLLARDISSRDWINDRPMTEYYMQMVDLNLPYEHQYFKNVILRAHHDAARRSRIDGMHIKMQADAMFREFQEWLRSGQGVTRYETTALKFGHKISQLVRSEVKNMGFRGFTKSRSGAGIQYTINVHDVVRDMVQQRWVAPDEV